MAGTPRRDVVVTGLGPVTPVGTGVEDFWQSLCGGVSGVSEIVGFEGVDLAQYRSRIAAQVTDFDGSAYLSRQQLRRLPRFAQLVLLAGKLAVDHAGLDLGKDVDPFRAGVIIGSGGGGNPVVEEATRTLAAKGPGRVSPSSVPALMANCAPGTLSIEFGLHGPSEAVSTACASGSTAVARACDLIRYGVCDIVLAGGTDAPVTPLSMAGFAQLRALSTRNEEPHRASRPFDRERDGFVMGEGAGVVVLESADFAAARGAVPLARILGYGQTSDAYNITAPHPEGIGAAAAMRGALRDAEAVPTDIGYINGHATSTPVGDLSEARAAHAVFNGSPPPMSAIKSMTGHLLGASGAVELAATVLTIDRGVMPPTVNQDVPDPACDLDVVPNIARHSKVDAALSNTFGFGGHNVAVCIARA